MMARSCILLLCYLLTGVAGIDEEIFMYSRLGDDIILPCTKLASTNCSLVSWTFYRDVEVEFTHIVHGGQVKAESDKAGRLSVTSNCSIRVRQLQVNDAGAYYCRRGNESFSIYLSLLSVTSPSSVTELQPGGNLSLNCILFTFYNPGNCKYSRMMELSWTDEDGMVLPQGSRYKLIGHSRCYVTLVTTLRREDDNRRWRCQATTKENVTEVFLDFTSIFLFEDPPIGQKRTPPSSNCPAQLPITRILLCVALPALAVVVGMLMRRHDRTRTPEDP